MSLDGHTTLYPSGRRPNPLGPHTGPSLGPQLSLVTTPSHVGLPNARDLPYDGANHPPRGTIPGAPPQEPQPLLVNPSLGPSHKRLTVGTLGIISLLRDHISDLLRCHISHPLVLRVFRLLKHTL